MKEWHIKIMEFQMVKNQKKDEAEEEKKRRMRLRGELPPEEEEEEEVWEPQAIKTIMPFKTSDGHDQFIISS
jgi:glutamate/tyrosine decarboxylase-like PLP-dependent enzyme